MPRRRAPPAKAPNSPWRPGPLRAICASGPGSWMRLGLLAGGLVVNRGQLEARLNLVDLDALLLAFELVDRQRLKKAILPLGQRRQTLLQLVHARTERGDPRRELAVVGGHAGPRLPDQHRALLSFHERGLELLYRAPFVPNPGLEALRQAPVHDPLLEAKLVAQVRQIRIIRMRREVVLDALQARPGLLLLRRAERRHVA